MCNAEGACVECLDNTTCFAAPKIACVNNHCSAPACEGGSQNGAETDKDCGGSECPRCDDGKYCMGLLDCASGVCQIPPGENKAKCTVPSCTDSVKNGPETDVDCGGPACTTRCPTAKKCGVGADCSSGVCQAGTCQAPTCTDGVKNGAETGIDCGSAAPGCFKCPG